MATMTIKEYCDKKGMEVRYIQKLIKEDVEGADHKKLLKEKWGINSYERIGNTYLLNVKKDFFQNP